MLEMNDVVATVSTLREEAGEARISISAREASVASRELAVQQMEARVEGVRRSAASEAEAALADLLDKEAAMVASCVPLKTGLATCSGAARWHAVPVPRHLPRIEQRGSAPVARGEYGVAASR